MSEAQEGVTAYALREEEYRYGSGAILVRNPVVISEADFGESRWFLIRAQTAAGTQENHGGWVDRELYVCSMVFHHMQSGAQTPLPHRGHPFGGNS